MSVSAFRLQPFAPAATESAPEEPWYRIVAAIENSISGASVSAVAPGANGPPETSSVTVLDPAAWGTTISSVFVVVAKPQGSGGAPNQISAPDTRTVTFSPSATSPRTVLVAPSYTHDAASAAAAWTSQSAPTALRTLAKRTPPRPRERDTTMDPRLAVNRTGPDSHPARAGSPVEGLGCDQFLPPTMGGSTARPAFGPT
jgi:hypothetical protein